MTLNDPLANLFSSIMNAERIGKSTFVVRPSSQLMKKILALLQDKKYVGNCEEVKIRGGNSITIFLLGAINRCGVVKPRYSVGLDNYTKYEKRYLPAKGFGILVVSTPKGLMTHEEAKAQHLGGRLLAYCY